MTDRPRGLRGAIRSALYQTKKHDLGCPASGECAERSTAGQVVACGSDLGCPRFLLPVEPQVDPRWLPRINLLVRIEGWINVGMKAAPNDLPPRIWDELTILAQERQRMDERVREQRDRIRHKQADEDKKLRAARQLDHLPPPGGTIF